MPKKDLSPSNLQNTDRYEPILRSIFLGGTDPVSTTRQAYKSGKISKEKYPRMANVYLNKLLKSGILKYQIEEKVLKHKARHLWEIIHNEMIPSDSQRETIEFLESKRLKVITATTREELYKKISTDLTHAIEKYPKKKILVGPGKTVNAISEYFSPDHAPKPNPGARMESLFLPAQGNMSTRWALDTEEYEYLYRCSANSNAMSLNNRLGLKTLYFDIPLLIELPRSLNPENPGVAIGLLKQMRRFYESTDVYRQIYEARNADNIGTILFSLGLTNTRSHFLRINAFLQHNYHKSAVIDSDSAEVLMRFYKGGRLVGTSPLKGAGLDPELSTEKALGLFYYCYLGLKEKFCKMIAKKHVEKPCGLGASLIIMDAWKLPATAIAVSGNPSMVNRLYILKGLLPGLREEIMKISDTGAALRSERNEPSRG
jgi:hypothetical protein